MDLINKIEEAIGPIFEGIDELGKFWVVTRPGITTRIIDIMFEADMKKMYYQFMGGLQLEEIAGIYKSKSKAKKLATDLLKK